jgi:hypothetical protein
MLLKAEGHNLPAATPFKLRESKLPIRYTYPPTKNRLAEPVERFYRLGFRTASLRIRSEKVVCAKSSIGSRWRSLFRSKIEHLQRSCAPLSQEATDNQTRRIESPMRGQKR